MNRKLIILLLLTTTFSCGKKKSSVSTIVEPSVPTTIEVRARDLEVTQLESVQFLRQEQLVNRYDCQGSLSSSKLETQNRLSKKITIIFDGRKDASSYTVFNRQTKSRNTGLATKEGKIIIDFAPTLFNLHVNEGLNEIEYRFYRCSKKATNDDGLEFCSGPEELMKEGIIQVDVGYSSEILPGEQNIYRSPESCKKNI